MQPLDAAGDIRPDATRLMEDKMRKLMVLALGLGLLSLPGIAVVPAKAQSIQPPHTTGAGSPYTTGALKRKKQVTAKQTGKAGVRRGRGKRSRQR
jgi:hypothetical protein